MFGAVFLIFLVLKLLAVDPVASWWWVTAPLWGGFALTLGVLAVPVFLMWVVGSVQSWSKRRSNLKRMMDDEG